MRLLVASALLGWTMSPAPAQVALQDEFSALDWEKWCPCRIDLTAIEPASDESASFARITVDDSAVGGNKCDQRERDAWTTCREPTAPALALIAPSDSLELRESLSPSLVRRSNMRLTANLLSFAAPSPEPAGGYFCTKEVRDRGLKRSEETDAPCSQRQEIQVPAGFDHRLEDALTYTFRFRMPRDLEDRINSIRWVTAQWKQTAISDSYLEEMAPEHRRVWGPSPFLAQRFDDGYLHVTVQDEHCQCLIAAEAGFPGKPAWEDGEPQRCESIDPMRPEHAECESKPSLSVDYGDNPDLTEARGKWVEMTYRVQAGRSGNAVIEVRQDGRRIVTVRGKIGYRPKADRFGFEEPTFVYFKMGHYRDYMEWAHAMDIDWVRIERPRP